MVDAPDSSESSDPKANRSVAIRRAALVFSILAVVGGTLVFPFPMEGRLWGSIFDLAHAPVFCLALICLVGIPDPSAIGLPKRFQTVWAMSPQRVLLTAGVLMTLGIVCEYLQRFAGRSPSWSDVLANTVGVIAGLTWIFSRSQQGSKRSITGLIPIAMLIAVNVSPALNAWDSVQQIRSFPMLASFERPRELRGWSAQNAAITQSQDWATNGTQSMKVTPQPGKYSGVSMQWFETDWSQFQSLQFDVRNTQTSALKLVIKVHDRTHWKNDFPANDRFDREITVPANEQLEVVLQLADIQSAPASRQMDLHDITFIQFFGIDIQQSSDWFIDNVRLVR